MKPTLQQILTTVSNYFDVPIEDICGPRRYSRIRDARHMYLFLAYQLSGVSMHKIAGFVNRDHSTVVHVMKKYEFMTDAEKYAYRDLLVFLTGKENGVSPVIQMYNTLGRHFMQTKTSEFVHRIAALNPKNAPKKYA